MFKFFAVILGAFLLSGQAQAQAGKPISEQIEEWYNLGQAVDEQEIRGGYSGRCYEVNSNNLPVGALLITDTIFKPIDNGPSFPKTDPLKMYLELFAGGDITRVDRLTPVTIKSTLVNFWQQMLYTETIFSSVGIRFWQKDAYNYSTFSVRRAANKYLVAMEHRITDNVVASERACYFFKKLN